MKYRIILIICIFAAVLLPPLLLKPKEKTIIADAGTERLVIITPHNDSTKVEAAAAFCKYYKQKFGKEIVIDYRAPGGTNDIVKYIADQYKIFFRDYAESSGIEWNSAVAAGFSNPHLSGKDVPAEVKKARALFLSSDVGIGIDLMFGGGVFELARQADAGYAVDAGIMRENPELLKPEIIPPFFGGEQLYDQRGRYYAVCLSTFGICCNEDRIAELPGKKEVPKRWADLAEPRFFNATVLADPSKSGSANKCYEIIIQQLMSEYNSPEKGWDSGMNLIKRMIANAAFITDSASKVTRDVAAGTVAAGMAIDTYGLTEQEWNEMQFDGKSHFRYIAPEGGTAVSSDPIQLLRGAPNPKAAKEFIKFMISPPGQRLICFKAGVPGGPQKYNLRRPPVRKDFYAPEISKYRSDPDYNPYKSGASFVYRPEWTGKYFSLLRTVIRVTMLDCHNELKEAWAAIIAAGGPEKVPMAAAAFDMLPFTYAEAGKAVAELYSKDTVRTVRLKRSWRDQMRSSFIRAKQLAEQGK